MSEVINVEEFKNVIIYTYDVPIYFKYLDKKIFKNNHIVKIKYKKNESYPCILVHVSRKISIFYSFKMKNIHYIFSYSDELGIRKLDEIHFYIDKTYYRNLIINNLLNTKIKIYL